MFKDKVQHFDTPMENEPANLGKSTVSELTGSQSGLSYLPTAHF